MIQGIAPVGGATAPAAGPEALTSVTLGQMITAGMGTLTTTGLGAAAGGIIGGGSSGVGSADQAMDAPAELRAYGNGRIPNALLTPIGIGQHRLWGPAAQSFMQMRSAAAADGASLSVTDSYRSYDNQVLLAAQKGLTKNGGWAAVPGTSEHGWGLAVDVDVDQRGFQWLQAHGAQYGWVQRSAREPWHWEFNGQPTSA
jgi:hypothetical protein